MTDSGSELEKAKVNLETSQIPWPELQRFFAAGLAIAVDKQLDLIEVAYQFSIDNKALVENWLKHNLVGPVSDQQAKDWYNDKTEVWAVVVKPWILVQDPNTRR
ncbi:DUF2288 domain-containing protein [Methylomonas sp. LL1]|uniref:DUF2288 domain-containing protein n=1 Tax=Methylomonas sp. LL1 TaxID=2785785 RepID=UPI0018C37109|nr:DUF2288 domain-containing protein [Methylomonas sp. LL1]QPK63668.1 DUF2288 domain-containing protein [Methylomonas sp. LL1]